MTQEEKAKAYDEAKEIIKGNLDALNEITETGAEVINIQSIKNCFYRAFPELKESEDEKIRKELIRFHKSTIDINGIKGEDIIAWLEKQGHDGKKWIYEDVYIKEKEQVYQDGVDDVLENPGKYGLVKKCEQKPKFKVGDWITNGQLTCKVLSVTSKSYELHLYNDDYCHFETDIQSVDKDYHLWSIEDAKDGDVLTSIGFHGNCTFIFKGLDNWKFDEPNGDRAVATGYCCLFASADKMEFGMQGPDCIEVDTVKPATKIQRDLLFQKMKEAGYSWDAEAKELSQSQVTKISDKEQFHLFDEEKMAIDIAIKALNHTIVDESDRGLAADLLTKLKQRLNDFII